MKRNFNVVDALFIVALVFKLRNLAPVPTWFEVFLPYLVEMVLSLITLFFAVQLKTWFFKKVIAWRVWYFGRKAKKQVFNSFKAGKASGNPGRVVDNVKEPNK